MEHESDMELMRLFAEKGEPGPDEAFVGRVSRRIRRHRNAQRILMAVIAAASVAVLAVLGPWLMEGISYITLGTTFFARTVVGLLFSPVGFSVGGSLGLFLFIKMR